MNHDTELSLDVWFKADIRNALVAVNCANLDIAAAIDTPEIRVYRKGYEAAIRAVAAVFGIDMQPSPDAALASLTEHLARRH
jgi:hypothetical protein